MNVFSHILRGSVAFLMCCACGASPYHESLAMAGPADEVRDVSTVASIKEMTDARNLNGTALGQENGTVGLATDPAAYIYHPEGRRDPFLAIVQDANKAVEVNLNVPPLQRVNLSEITLIGIVWGGFGYIGMVQTPDGRGYTVREGTNVGSNDGTVRLITAEALIIKEPFIDVVGRKEIREHLLPLHPKINTE